MSREPYEKPQVTQIEAGQLLDEASRRLHSALNHLESAKVESDRIRGVVASIEADVAAAMLDLDTAKNATAKIDAVIELTREAHGLPNQR